MIRILRNNGLQYLSNVLYEISLMMISAVIFKYVNRLIIRIYFGWKTIQFYSNIICNLDKFYMVLIKFAYLPPLNCTRDRILSLVSVQGTNGGQNQEKLIQCFIIPVCLMWWLSILSKLDSFFFYFLLHVV